MPNHVCMGALLQCSFGVAPSSARASATISRQRRAWAAGSGSHEPSGHTGPVPDTQTRSPTRIARFSSVKGRVRRALCFLLPPLAFASQALLRPSPPLVASLAGERRALI